MYEKSQQLTGNSISRLIETQRKENPYKIYETNDIRESQNVIFRYPYLMEKSTEKIKDDSRSDKGSEKPLPRTQQRKKIFEAKSTLQSQMKHSTLSMDRNRTNSANNYDKNPVRQKIKNSSNKSYGRRVSQQGSFTHSVPLTGQPVIFNYQSPQGSLFHPTVTLGQKSQIGSRYPFGVVNYSSMPIQKIPQKISLSTYPSPIFESRATHLPMKTSNIYATQQEAKLNPIIAQSYIHPIGKIQPSQTCPFPPGYPPVYINNNFQPNPPCQSLPPHNHIFQQKKSPQQSPAQIKNHSPIKIKNIKNILNQNPNINLQQFQPKCVNSPTIPQSLTNSSNLREINHQNQIKNVKHVHYHDDVKKEEKNGQKQGRKLEQKHHNNGGLIIHGHGEHFPVQAFQHQPPNRNMYETYKSGQRFMKNNHPKILNHGSKQQSQIRKKAPSITSFASNANLQQQVQYSIDLKQAQEAENLDQPNQPQYSDRFFDMQIKNSVHHDQHKTHKHFHKVPQVKKHFSEDFNKSPESSPSHHHEHHKVHQKDSLKPSQNLNLESPSKKQKKTGSSSYNQSKVQETSASQKKEQKNKQTLMQKYNNQGNLTIFFLIFLGFLLVLLQAIK